MGIIIGALSAAGVDSVDGVDQGDGVDPGDGLGMGAVDFVSVEVRRG